MFKTVHFAAGFATAMVFCASPSSAADLGGNCCADLEERIAELEATAARKGNRKVSLTISGLVNETLMYWDDGRETNAYVVTNETKRTRVAFTGSAKIDPSWTAGYNLELGPRGDRMDRKDQNDTVGTGAFSIDVRYSYWFIRNKSLGQVAMGLQPTASDTITEITVANTNHFARPAPTQQIGDGGRGYLLRLQDGSLSSLAFGDIVTQGVNGTPGEGHRLNAVRYDTPEFAGFVASASWGEDDVWDVALRYKGELGGFKLAAGIGYAEWTNSLRGCAQGTAAGDFDCEELGMSASVMHIDTGLFVTGAFGYRKDNNIGVLYAGAANADDTQDFYFVQAGIEQKWFSIGKTTIFGEFWNENAGAGLTSDGLQLDVSDLKGGPRMSQSEISVWGAGINQTLAEGVDVYLSYRHVNADVFTSADGGRTGETKVEIEPFQYVTAGAAIKF